MVQEILMWASVSGAFAYTAYGLVKSIWSAYQEKQPGCAGACSGCSAKNDLLKKVKHKHIRPIQLINQKH